MSTDPILKTLRKKLLKVAGTNKLESLAKDRVAKPAGESTIEALTDGLQREVNLDNLVTHSTEVEESALQKLENGDFDDISPRERIHLEAIVEEEGRPVVFVRENTFDDLPEPWLKFNAPGEGKPKWFIEKAIPAIGRVEIPAKFPGGEATHIGTGCIVGHNLMMTNRHVARAFVNGVGRDRSRLSFTPGRDRAINFRREYYDPDASLSVELTDIVMMHPFWDMALFRLEGLPREIFPLRLSVTNPEDLVDRDIAVLGYPAKYNNPTPKEKELEAKHYQGIYGVKRLAPGEVIGRESVGDFEYPHLVQALTHDSSTLPGNSGSTILDVSTGEVVGLHFAGVTLKANYSVPIFELARDRRVVDVGLAFNYDRLPVPTKQWEMFWKAANPELEFGLNTPPTAINIPTDIGAQTALTNDTATWTIPITISVTLEEAWAGSTAYQQPESQKSPLIESSFQNPVIYEGLGEREGYDPAFLGLDNDELVPLPQLTEKGEQIVSRMENGSCELKYHRFSVVVHKQRRLALFTASNANWRKRDREIAGRKPSRSELTGIPKGVLEEWVNDPRIPEEEQLPDLFFTKDRGAFDKGHLVKRDEVAWSTKTENIEKFKDMQMSNGDTYHTTNCSPQVGSFNQSSKGVDNWGDLENTIQKQASAEKVMIFSGPVLSKYDRIFKGIDQSGVVKIQVPQKYWKIVVAKTEDGPRSFGFLLQQNLADVPLEFTIPTNWKPYQVPIQEIEDLLFDLVSLEWFKDHDQMIP